jgi:hypothetical protein
VVPSPAPPAGYRRDDPKSALGADASVESPYPADVRFKEALSGHRPDEQAKRDPGGISEMSEAATAETDDVDLTEGREVSLSTYPGREPVTVRTTHLDGEEPTREERIRAGLRRLAREGRIPLPR